MIAYDLHIHSCLSPCADDDMTPKAIVDRAVENGLDIIAITDHNSTDNAEAAMEAAGDRIAVIPGIEVESSEEVHVVCLFPNMVEATRMDRLVTVNMHNKYNKPNKFGNQLIVDEFDGVVSTEDKMLRFPTKMTVEEIFYAARQMKGVAFYAHLEQKAYSVLSVLGTIPERPEPKAVEYTNSEEGKKFYEKKGSTGEKLTFWNSDAHKLSEIASRETAGDLEELGANVRDENGKVSVSGFIDWLREQPGI